jgi:hypothetical protein
MKKPFAEGNKDKQRAECRTHKAFLPSFLIVGPKTFFMLLLSNISVQH